MKIQEITEELLKYLPNADIGIVQKAYEYSAKAHLGQSRRSGEAYISHPIQVARNLVRLKMDENTLAAGWARTSSPWAQLTRFLGVGPLCIFCHFHTIWAIWGPKDPTMWQICNQSALK